MRVLIQRVSEASVHIDGQTYASIGKGLLLLLGIEENDQEEDISWLCAKISKLRIFPDADGVMNVSACDANAEMIVVSQFTLFASTRKGNRPSYIRAARPETAIPLYEAFIRVMEKELGRPVQTGRFGADMQIALINDGPVSIWIDSKNKE